MLDYSQLITLEYTTTRRARHRRVVHQRRSTSPGSAASLLAASLLALGNPHEWSIIVTGSEELIRQARTKTEGGLPGFPRRRGAVIACIDSRIQPELILGGTPGDYHVIRNAGGLVTDDAVRSLMVSQFHGTNQVIVMMHTDCGAMAYPATREKQRLEAETGERITFAIHDFTDLETELRRGVDLLRSTRLLSHRDRIKGTIYDVDTLRLRTLFE